MALTTRNNQLHFSFPEIHPEAQVTIEFQRTLRIPDDGKNYPLPPGLGTFPLKHVDDHADRVPSDWQKRGGVMLPMYQSEAMWINFHPHYVRNRVGTSCYPFAIRIAAGMRSAITGDEWQEKLTVKDYVVIPKQRWIDGFVVEEGKIRQFVAMPLGQGFTVEEQLTGEAEFGGVQIQVFPMKRKVFERRFPVRPPSPVRSHWSRGRLYGASLMGASLKTKGLISHDSATYDRSEVWDAGESCAINSVMGLGAGGTMKQEIYPDPYDFEDWKQKKLDSGNRCFVHLANSIAWKAITTQDPPYQAPTAADYTRAKMPWFDHYTDSQDALKANKQLKHIKSVLELGFQKGVPGLIENESCKPKNVVSVGPNVRPKKDKKKRKKDAVRDGSWT